MGKKKADSVVNVPETPFSRFQGAIRAWMEARKQSMAVLEKLLEVRSKKSYTSIGQVSTAIGTSMGASRVNVQVEAELYGQLQRMQTTQGSMLASLQVMRTNSGSGGNGNSTSYGEQSGALVSHAPTTGTGTEAGTNAPIWPLEISCTESLLHSLQQQTLVEVSVYEMLLEEQEAQGGVGQGQSSGTCVCVCVCVSVCVSSLLIFLSPSLTHTHTKSFPPHTFFATICLIFILTRPGPRCSGHMHGLLHIPALPEHGSPGCCARGQRVSVCVCVCVCV